MDILSSLKDHWALSNSITENSMGCDYSSIHVFAQADNAAQIRRHIIDQLPGIVPGCLVPESQSTRSIVVGPPDRWIFVGDSASATEGGDPVAVDVLVQDLSMIAPTLVIHMSDSACVHMYLHHNGELVDKFGTGRFPFFPFESDEEAASFRGNEHKWARLIMDSAGPSLLRSVWDKKMSADWIVESTAKVLGIHPSLAACGYTVFNEADEIPYRDWLQDEDLLSRSFDEFHLKTAEHRE